MPNRVPLQSICLLRDGKTFTPPIGEVFNFTADEVADIEQSNPDAFSETASVDAEVVEVKAAATKGGKAKKAEEL